MVAVREKQEIGLPVTGFSLPLVNGGGSRTLDSYLEGKKGAVILFWSGICSHCLRYDTYLNEFQQKNPDYGFVAIASRHGETLEKLQATIAERKLTFPILHDPNAAVAKAWYTQQTPRVFLIDSNKELLYRGALDNFKFPDDHEYVRYLEPAMDAHREGKSVEKSETASFGCAISAVYYILPKGL